MNTIKHILLVTLSISVFAVSAMAQDNGGGSSASMRRGQRKAEPTSQAGNVTQRMQSRLQSTPTADNDLAWMRVIYRQLDLTKPENAPLYFPEPPRQGEENLFRTIMRLMADGTLPVYEYQDGREEFTEARRLKQKDVFDRFHIEASTAKGHTEKNPRYTVAEADVPADEVLSYYIIERCEFDTRTNRMHIVIEAICPVLHRANDWGMEAVKYPMFWIKFDDLRPYMSTQAVFISDDNNLPTCTYDDYFRLGLYNGEIVKTRNLRNLSMRQLYPDDESLRRAQDSIQATLDNFDKKLWVPSLDELKAAREAREKKDLAAAQAQDADTLVATTSPAAETKQKLGRRAATTKRAADKSKAVKAVKVKRAKTPKAKAPKATNSSATRSVRNRRR